MFTTTSKWGFPHKVAQIVSQYETGLLLLDDALARLASLYGSTINTYYTYDHAGNKCSHTCIEFGLPVVARYEF